MKFVTGEPALLDGKMLVISDLHVGIEHEYRRSGIKMPSQTAALERRLDRLLETTKAQELLVCGDIKHKVPGRTFQEEREIPALFGRLTQRVRVHVVLGNHDADLRPLLPPDVTVHPTEGVLVGKTYFSHGHTWPDASFLDADTLVVGHVQPQIEIRDRLGYVWREPVWVRATLDSRKVRERYPGAAAAPDLIILPAFNPMAGGLALNVKDPGDGSPILKLARLPSASLYLVDGTLLGPLSRLSRGRPSPGSKRSPRR